MSEHVPDRDEMLAFLDRMIAEARRLGEVERMDALLDKRANVDEQLAFLAIVLQGR